VDVDVGVTVDATIGVKAFPMVVATAATSQEAPEGLRLVINWAHSCATVAVVAFVHSGSNGVEVGAIVGVDVTVERC